MYRLTQALIPLGFFSATRTVLAMTVNELSVLHQEFMLKNPDFAYKEHNKLSLEEKNDAEFLAR